MIDDHCEIVKWILEAWETLESEFLLFQKLIAYCGS